MELYLYALLAGALTVLSPCVFAVLPLVLGNSLTTSKWYRPLIVILSLITSVFTFSLLLKATTVLISVPDSSWQIISGLIILLVGLSMLFPLAWSQLALRVGLLNRSEEFLHNSVNRKNVLSEISIGVALGPVFTSCSPTYGLIVASILPVNFSDGFVALLSYVFGLGIVLLLVALLGQRLLQKLGWAFNPRGVFRRGLGVVFVIFGILILFGLEKRLEAALLDIPFINLTSLERDLFDLEKLSR